MASLVMIPCMLQEFMLTQLTPRSHFPRVSRCAISCCSVSGAKWINLCSFAGWAQLYLFFPQKELMAFQLETCAICAGYFYQKGNVVWKCMFYPSLHVLSTIPFDLKRADISFNHHKKYQVKVCLFSLC